MLKRQWWWEELAVLWNQKDCADFDHLLLLQCKTTAPGSPASRQASWKEAYYNVHGEDSAIVTSMITPQRCHS